LYVPEFTEVYTSDALEVIGMEECRAQYADRYRGRVPEGNYRITHVGTMRPGRKRLEIRVPSLRGEWKLKKDGAEDLEAAGEGAVLVKRGSPEEKQVLAERRRILRDEA
jgi:hypothetical protein